MNKTEKEYNYYWYHHMVFSGEEREKINKIILDHNWAAFSEYFKKYDNEYYTYNGERFKVCYFPDRISVYTENEDDDDYEIDDIPLNEETFKLITFTECECG